MDGKLKLHVNKELIKSSPGNNKVSSDPNSDYYYRQYMLRYNELLHNDIKNNNVVFTEKDLEDLAAALEIDKLYEEKDFTEEKNPFTDDDSYIFEDLFSEDSFLCKTIQAEKVNFLDILDYDDDDSYE